MTIALQFGAENDNNSSSISFTISGAANGAMLLAFLCGTTTFSTPAGWTALGTVSFSGSVGSLFYKVKEPSDTTVVFTRSSGSGRQIGFVLGYTTTVGWGSGSCYNFLSNTDAGTTTIQSPVYTNVSGETIVSMGATNQISGAAVGTVSGTGWTIRGSRSGSASVAVMADKTTTTPTRASFVLTGAVSDLLSVLCSLKEIPATPQGLFFGTNF